MNPPAALKTDRANTWKHYKSLRSRYGRQSETVSEALIRFNEYEQRLSDNYAETPKLFHAYICKNNKTMHVSVVLNCPLTTLMSESKQV